MSSAAAKRPILAAIRPTGPPGSHFVGYLLAAVLPIAASLISARVSALHGIPLALLFIAVAFLAAFAGLGPALLALVVGTASSYLIAMEMHKPIPVDAVEALRILTLGVSAVIISLMTRSHRRTSQALAVALAALQEQTAALIESQQASKCASWTYSANDKTRWYPGGYEVFGMPFAELEELPSPIALIWPEDQPRVRSAVQEMIANRTSMVLEYRVMFPNGELHWSEARGTPVEGQPHLWRGVTFDVTERKLAEAALIRSEKLAAMGRLASTVAHEINNPLEAVTNLLYLARRDPDVSQNADANLALAERELARVGEITRLTLGFIRNSPARRHIEIAEGVEDVLALFRHRFEMKNIHIERRYQHGVMVEMAPQELRQIVTNLISNAIDACSGPEARVNVHIEQTEDRAGLVIEDNGSGIPESHLQKIFDPFFSTKDDTGTGIGLWVTRELVERSGGVISANSGGLSNGMSTCFRIEFPATNSADKAFEASTMPARLP